MMIIQFFNRLELLIFIKNAIMNNLSRFSKPALLKIENGLRLLFSVS